MKSKRLYVTLLAMLMLFAFILVSCASDEGNENSVRASEPQQEEEELNFYGAYLKLYSYWGDNFKASEAFSITTDLQLQRFKECKEKYNFEFVVMDYSAATPLKVTTSVGSGTDIPDLIDVAAYDAYTLYKSDYLAAAENIPTIDLTTTRWGTVNFRRYGQFNGVQYGLYWYDWDDLPQYAGILLFNNELITAMNMDSPYEHIENKSWNWDYFSTAVEQGTSITEDFKQLGLGILDTRFFVETVIFSNGGQLVDNSTGKYACSLGTPESMAALEYASELYKSEYAASCALDGFTDNKFVYLSSETWQGTVMSETARNENRPLYSMNDFGMLPFPSGPAATPSTSSAFTNCNRRMFWIIDASDNSNEDIGTMMSIVFAPLPGCNPESWRDRAESFVFMHTESLNNYVSMLDTCQYDYTTELYSVMSSINSSFTSIISARQTVFEAIESLTDKIDTVCDAELNS